MLSALQVRRARSFNPLGLMNRIFGYLVGIVWLGLAFGAFQNASAGRVAGQEDVGFWWTVIAGILTVAAVGALVGTTIHARSDQG